MMTRRDFFRKRVLLLLPLFWRPVPPALIWPCAPNMWFGQITSWARWRPLFRSDKRSVGSANSHFQTPFLEWCRIAIRSESGSR